jgi:hypothetical protein
MKNVQLLVSLITISLLLFSSCTDCIKAEGDSITEVLEIAEFNAIDLDSKLLVNISQGNEQKVEITAPANIIALLNRSVRNNTWVIDFEDCIKAKNIQINITLPSLQSITVNGSGSVKGLNNLNVNDMEINILGSGEVDLLLNSKNATTNIEGSGNIKIKGSSTNLFAKISGSGDVDAFEFVTVKSSIDLNGSGDVYVNANELYEVNISGSGDVEYKDTGARIISDVSGSGKITRK